LKYNKLNLKDYYDFLGEKGKNPQIELYLPENLSEMGRQNQKRATILVCPGGGYQFCSTREAEPVALNFLKYGYNVIVLWYSVAPNTFPTQLLEVAAAMDLIYKKSDEWNCDTNKITIMGFSAGGHLAAHYSTCFDIKEVREYFPDSHRVNAGVLAYPVIIADPDKTHIKSFLNLSGKTEITQEVIENFSLEKKVNDNTPPTFIWHTAEDDLVPVYNSLRYANALTEHKIPYELHIYPFGGHGLCSADEQTCDTLSEKESIVNSWIEDANKFLHFVLDK